MTRLVTVRQKLLLAFGSAACTLIVGFVAVAMVLRIRTATSAVERSVREQSLLEHVLRTLVDAETGQRGFVITGDSAYLAPYNAALAAAEGDLDSLRTVIGSQRLQRARFDSLVALVHAKNAELSRTIGLRATTGFAAAAPVIRAGAGKRYMDAIRDIVSEMEGDARAMVARTDLARTALRRAAIATIVVGSVLAFLFAFLVNRSIQLDVIEQLRVQDQLEQQAQELEEQAVELEYTNEQLQEASANAEEARDAADLANRAKSDFLAVMSHELRTPLNAIVGYADLIRDGVAGTINDTQRHHLERIQLSARHLVSLVDEILSYARIEGGREQIAPGDVDVAGVTRDAGAMVEPVATAKGLRFSVAVPNEPLRVHSDGGRIRQVLVNLLANAIKFTDRGEIALASAPENGRVVFTVRDTGIGIAPEHLEHIFEPFWQADQTATRRTGGAGLGLSVSQKLARALGGDLTVSSTVGGGSEFTFWVPR